MKCLYNDAAASDNGWQFLKSLDKVTKDPKFHFKVYKLQRNENTRLHKNLHTSFISSITHNNHKVESTQMFISWWWIKDTVYSQNEILFGHKKEWSTW